MIGREAEVILHVAVAADGLGQVVALELVEDHPVRLVEDVGQHVQPAAVRHAHDDLADPARAGPLDHGVEQRDQHLAAFEREPLLADVMLLKKRLEQLGRVELQDDPPLLLGVELRAVPVRLHPFEQPLRILVSRMCMNSTPIVRQYVSRRIAISSASVERPASLNLL